MTHMPEQLEMARRIAADTARAQGFANRPQMFLDARWDGHASVQSALAAIIETTELAAAYADSGKGIYNPIEGNHSLTVHASKSVAVGLRANAHLKGRP